MNINAQHSSERKALCPACSLRNVPTVAEIRKPEKDRVWGVGGWVGVWEKLRKELKDRHSTCEGRAFFGVKGGGNEEAMQTRWGAFASHPTLLPIPRKERRRVNGQLVGSRGGGCLGVGVGGVLQYCRRPYITIGKVIETGVSEANFFNTPREENTRVMYVPESEPSCVCVCDASVLFVLRLLP